MKKIYALALIVLCFSLSACKDSQKNGEALQNVSIKSELSSKSADEKEIPLQNEKSVYPKFVNDPSEKTEIDDFYDRLRVRGEFSVENMYSLSNTEVCEIYDRAKEISQKTDYRDVDDIACEILGEEKFESALYPNPETKNYIEGDKEDFDKGLRDFLIVENLEEFSLKLDDKQFAKLVKEALDIFYNYDCGMKTFPEALIPALYERNFDIEDSLSEYDLKILNAYKNEKENPVDKKTPSARTRSLTEAEVTPLTEKLDLKTDREILFAAQRKNYDLYSSRECDQRAYLTQAGIRFPDYMKSEYSNLRGLETDIEFLENNKND